MLQQIEQFRSLGEEFEMQHADTEYMGDLEDELQEEVLRRFTPEQVAGGLSDEQAARLRELLERRQGK